jgi:hypothetical protein
MRTITLTGDESVEYLPKTKRLVIRRKGSEELVSLRTPAGYWDGDTIVFRSLKLMIEGRRNRNRLGEIWVAWRGTE